MTETGELPIRNILTVLRKHQVTIGVDGDQYTLAKGERVEVFKLGDEVSRHMAQKLARTFKAPIHEFYNPVAAVPTAIDAKKKKPA